VLVGTVVCHGAISRFDTTLVGTNSDPDPSPILNLYPHPQTPGDERKMAIAKITANGLNHIFYLDNNGNFGHNFQTADGSVGT
jgi:hypothetical protein